MSRSAPSWLATQLGDVYTLHFWPPYGDPEGQQAGHYTGWAREGGSARVWWTTRWAAGPV